MYSAISSLGYSPGIEQLQTTDSQDTDDISIPEPIASSLATAASDGKLVLIDFYAEWCAACILLEETALRNPAVLSALENYQYLKVDTDLYERAANYYEVVGMPTLLVLTSEGKEIYRSMGLIEPEELSSKLNELVGK